MKRKIKQFIQHLGHDYDDSGTENHGYGPEQEALEESLSLVGLVVTVFNSLEKQIDALICSRLSDRSDAVGLLVIHGMHFAAKLDLYKRFEDDMHRSADFSMPSYAGLIDALKEVARLRNLIVHADWDNTDAEGFTYTRLKLSSNGMQQEYVQFTPESMMKVVDAIADAHGQLGRYEEERFEGLGR